MSQPDYAPDDFKCGTFDPKVRALITPEIRAKMDADFERAQRERELPDLRALRVSR